jgi:hypothetical protein
MSERHVIFVLCLPCKHKWTASCIVGNSLFRLECPNCGEHNSFPSFVPEWFLVALEEMAPGDNEQ